MQFLYPVTLPTRISGNFRNTRFRMIKLKVQYPAHPNMVAEQNLHFPAHKTAPTKILFRYLYRDASNYKQHGEVVFSNRTFLPLDEIERQVQACLQDGKYFIARQVHIEERFFDAQYDDDHPWHEFSGVENTTQLPFDPDHANRTGYFRDIREFLADLETAHRAGWDEMNIREDLACRFSKF